MNFDEILEQFKQGIQTSEFWFGLLAAVWVVLKTAIDPTKTWSENIAVIAPLLAAAVYAFCRSWLKRRRVDVLLNAPPAPPEGGA